MHDMIANVSHAGHLLKIEDHTLSPFVICVCGWVQGVFVYYGLPQGCCISLEALLEIFEYFCLVGYAV